MAKGAGGTRRVSAESRDARYSKHPRKKRQFEQEIQSGKYNTRYSFFDEKSGGSLLIEANRVIDNNEVNAGMFLALSGETVKMTMEGGGIYVLASYGGSNHYGYGFITVDTFGESEDFSYEQRTVDPVKFPFRASIRNAINHALDKGARIALIYDKNWKISQNEIRKGMRDFKKATKNKRHQTVEQVWIINGVGKVSKWNLKNDTV